MFDWLFGKKRWQEKTITEMRKISVVLERSKKLHQSIATVSSRQWGGSGTESFAATASAILVEAVVLEAKAKVDNDDDRFVAGVVVFAFADYFAQLLNEEIETVALHALAQVIGMEQLPRFSEVIMKAHNDMVSRKSILLQSLGKSCANWYYEPTAENLAKLTKLYLLLKSHKSDDGTLTVKN